MIPASRQSAVHPRVAIVGSGFAGLAAAKALAEVEVEVVVIDRRNHHLFQPLLYQVATAGLNPSDIAFPIRSILRKQSNVRVLLDEVVSIDRDHHTIETMNGPPIQFDYAIVAAGATHSYFGHDEWERQAPGLKTIEDAIEIRRRILLAFEHAERTTNEDERKRLLTFIVIGGGPTGVELAGAIAEIATTTLSKDFRSIDPSNSEVILVEGADRILTTYSPKLSRRAAEQLGALGVRLLPSTMVTAIDDRGVTTDSGRIESACVLWAAGVAASPIGQTLGAATDRTGRVIVEADLSIPDDPNIFVVGDLASIRQNGAPVPGVAPAAMQAGRHAASQIVGDVAGHDRKPFVYHDKGSLATIGRSSAVAAIGRFEFWGFTAWTLWWSIHIAYLIGFRSRVLVMFGWAWSWLTYQRTARLITRPWRSGAKHETD